MAMDATYDVVIIGAGFGGLATSLALAEEGAKVALCENLSYPGGCASTFERGGYKFETGATLFSGLASKQLFGGWIDRYGLDVQVDWLNPLVELRTSDLRLSVSQRRDELLNQFLSLPDAPVLALSRFMREQRRIADTLWRVLEDATLLPPLNFSAVFRHALRAAEYARPARWMGWTLEQVLARFGLAGFEPLRIFLDALCQITLQCSSSQAEAPLAMAAMDYYYRGTGHVRHGVGQLAVGLCDAVRLNGGEVKLANGVRAIKRVGDGWHVETRSGVLRTRQIVANLLPEAVRNLLPSEQHRHARFNRLEKQVSGGWGAVMLYRIVREPFNIAADPMHLQLIQDSKSPLLEGNHVFVSVSGAYDQKGYDAGSRSLTASTHIALDRLRGVSHEEQAALVQDVQASMRRTLARRAPEWSRVIETELTASPRTYARFTGRSWGAVGGVPRRSGLHNYLASGPFAVLPGLWLVGDSVLPGQGTLAAALGGVRLARQVMTQLDLRSSRSEQEHSFEFRRVSIPSRKRSPEPGVQP